RSAILRSSTTWPSSVPRMMSATGSSMSDPATSTERTAVMSPELPAPGPARSATPIIARAEEGGQPRKDPLSPGASATWRYMQALVAEMLGHRHGRQGAAAAHQRRLVRGRRHHDRPRHAFRPQHPFGEIAQLAPAFADQRNHHHIRRQPAGEPCQKRGLAHAGPRKKPDPLPPDQRQKRVEHGDSGGEPDRKSVV